MTAWRRRCPRESFLAVGVRYFMHPASRGIVHGRQGIRIGEIVKDGAASQDNLSSREWIECIGAKEISAPFLVCWGCCRRTRIEQGRVCRLRSSIDGQQVDPAPVWLPTI